MSTHDFTHFDSRLFLTGTLHLDTSLRIGAGRTGDLQTATELSVVKDATGAPYIPGSSFKGALRAYVESILRTITEDELKGACLCVTQVQGKADGCITTRASDRFQEQVEAIRKKIKDKKAPPDALERFYLNETCRACQVFGSPWAASKALVRDLPVTSEWLGRFQYRDGVAIDRDTETASEGKLYSFEAVPAGTEFAWEIIVENATPEEQGMLLLGLMGFQRGQVPLGGGRSRGLGRATLKLDLEHSYELDTAREGGKKALLDYLFTGQGNKLTREAMESKIDAFRASLGVPNA